MFNKISNTNKTLTGVTTGVKVAEFSRKALDVTHQNDPYYQYMPKDNINDALNYSIKYGGEIGDNDGGCLLI